MDMRRWTKNNQEDRRKAANTPEEQGVGKKKAKRPETAFLVLKPFFSGWGGGDKDDENRYAWSLAT